MVVCFVDIGSNIDYHCVNFRIMLFFSRPLETP